MAGHFNTHTGLHVSWTPTKVLLIGDRTKVLYPKPGEAYVEAEAKKVFEYTVAHYKARAAAAKADKKDDTKTERQVKYEKVS